MNTLNIKRSDCEELLRKRFKTNTNKILSYQITPLDGGRSGIMGEHWILKIEIENNQVITFFIKSSPRMESQVFYTKHVNIAYKEESFYDKIIPAMKKLNISLISKITPTCYVIRASQFLIFEDLSIIGYKIYPSIHSLSDDAVKLGLSTLAKLHACSFAFEEAMTAKMRQDYRIIDHFEEELQETFFCLEIPSEKLIQSILKTIPTQIKLFPELYTHPDLSQEELEDFILHVWRNVKEYVKQSTIYRNVICHADTWSSNMMYQEANGILKSCILIDFQMHRYCPPAQDVLLFLYLTTDREFRSKHMLECLDFYYESLKETLSSEFSVEIENVLTKNDFENSCNYYELFAIGQCLAYSHLTKVKSTVLGELFDNSERSNCFMYADRSDFLIEFCEKDAFYKDKQKESLLNFIDAYVKFNVNVL